MRRFFARLKSLFRKENAERELRREIEAHLALLQEDFERRGMTPEEARRAARRAYGGVEQAKEQHREERSFLSVENFIKDIRFGARDLWRTPGFTAVAVAALALGIGANTAIFSVVNAVLLRPLAYRDADRLVTILHDGTNPVATANYLDWRDQSHSFTAMGAADAWSANLTTSGSDGGGTMASGEPAEHLIGMKVTQNLLPMLGVEPLFGRVFRPGEDKVGADHEVLLSYGLWQRRYAGDRAVLGKTIALDGQGYTVIGVTPAGFHFAPFWVTKAELWVPDAFGKDRADRGGNHLRVFARLKPGVTLKEARADMATVTARLEKQYPATNRSVLVRPLKENVVGKIRGPLLMLLSAVGFVLLIACANVAHMLLARTSDRRREIAVRTALGASRGRVLVQFLTENLLLAAVGAAFGLLLAITGTQALVVWSPEYIPRADTVGMDGYVALFLLAITVGTALAFGLVPAMHAAAGNLSEALKEGGRGDSGGVERLRLRSFLVASEFALAFMLLIGSGLAIRSFVALMSVDAGFDPNNVLSMQVSVAGTKETEAGQREMFYRQVLEKLRAMPGVTGAGAINHLPLAGDLWGRSFDIEGRGKARPGEEPEAVYRIVMPGYFETMRLPLRRGRDITDRDDTHAPGVVVINERAARRYWPGEDPVGKRISLRNDAKGQPVWVTVVAVTADAQEENWAAPLSPEIYLPALQSHDFLGDGNAQIGPHMSYITLVVRSAEEPAELARQMKRVVWSFDSNLAISNVLTMRRAVADATAQPRFEMWLLTVFAAVALVLAGVGIYGIVNYSVARRTREIGIRMSLGAGRGDVLRMVTRQAMKQAGMGAAAGVVGAVLLSRLMTRMLYGVKPMDPLTFAAVALVLGAAALVATCVPAIRAARIEPMMALREE